MKTQYLPEAHHDFVFFVIGNKAAMVSAICGLFLLVLLIFIVWIKFRQKK